MNKHSRLIPITGEGQLVVGDVLKIDAKSPKNNYRRVKVKQVLVEAGDEEIVLASRKVKNAYFITKMLADGSSWAGNVYRYEREEENLNNVTISMIAAMANNNVIGKDNALPWSQPADLAHFKRTTMGKPIVMGRKTFDSIGRPLPGRENIVITRSDDFAPEGVTVVKSISEALEAARKHEEVMIIGGDSIYEQCLPYADTLYVTHILADIDGDAYFPDFMASNEWVKSESVSAEADEKNEYAMSFAKYVKAT